MRELNFTDLAMLAAIRWYERSQFKFPNYNDLLPPGGLVNDWREEFGVGGWHMMPLTSVDTTQRMFTALKDAGFVKELKNRDVTVTDKGQWLLDQVGYDWQQWPLEFSIDRKGRVISESAVY